MKFTHVFAIAVALAAALSLGAGGIMPFRNFEKNGAPVLIPSVQKYDAAAGEFALPQRLAVSIPAGEELIAEQLGDELERFGVAVGTGSDALCRFVLTDDGVPAHDQGYTLTIRPEGITVASRAPAGLFHGAQTLCNILRNAGAPKLKCCIVTDWPDFDRRGYFFSIRKLPPEKLPLLKKSLDMMAKLKINWIMLELADAFPFKDNPYTKRKNAFTEAQVRDIIEYCRKRHIEITPTLQVWSHAAWMTSHPDWNKMKEGVPKRHWYSQPCPYNRQARILTARAIDEHIELFKPKTFLLMMDEMFFGPFQSCPKCRATDPVELFGGVVREYEGQVLRRGVEPMVCHDSFVDNRAYKWTFGDQLRSALDPKTLVLWWNYRDKLPEHELVPFKDFALAGHALHGKPHNLHIMAKLIKKYGGKACTFAYWYYSRNGMLAELDEETPDGYGGFAIGADYLWRLTDKPHQEIDYDGTFEMMRLIHPEMLFLPKPGERAVPLPLGKFVNAELSRSGRFPRLDDAATGELGKLLAALPERFELLTSPGGKYYAILLNGDKRETAWRNGVSIDFRNRTAQRISLLATTSRPLAGMDYFARNRGRKTFEYAPAAKLRWMYADGTEAAVMLKFRRDITDWNRQFGGFNCRFPFRGVDLDKNYYSFGICDVENPHPEKAVKSVVFSTAKLNGIAPALLAASVWGADRAFAPPKTAFTPDDRRTPPGVSALKMRLHAVTDFDKGMGKVSLSGTPQLLAALKQEIVDDPAYPTHGKVLKITLPPGDYRGSAADGRFVRLNVDVPNSLGKNAKALFADYFLDDPGHMLDHIGDYLIRNDPDQKKFDFHSMPVWAVEKTWTRDIHAFWQMTTVFRDKDLYKKLARADLRRLSFFFTAVKTPVEIRIGSLGDTPDEFSTAPLWKEHGEAEPRW